MLRVDPRNPRATELHARLLDAGAGPALDALGDDVCAVIGGDGFLLHTIHELGAERIYLGLNAGTLGFLLNDVADRFASVVLSLMHGEYTVTEFPVLEVTGLAPDGSQVYARAINDVYVERTTGQIARLGLSIDTVRLVETLACDGLIVATALGTTAYAYSAGGTPCHPAVRAMQVTPICPHAPRLSPLTLPLSSVVEVHVQSPDRRPVRVVCDGVEHGPVAHLRVSVADVVVRLAFFEGHDFTGTLVDKILKV